MDKGTIWELVKSESLGWSATMYCIFASIVVSVLVGCASLETVGTSGRHFILANVETIHPGVSTKRDVLAIFGEPDWRIDLTEGTYRKSNAHCWSYLEEPNTVEYRVSVEFHPNSDIVSSVGWAVREGERERSLDVALSLFPNGKFETQRMPTLNPHVEESRVFYKENRLGALIIYDRHNHQVESISWMESAEIAKRTAYENFDYPEVCMQGRCVHSSPEIEKKLEIERKLSG